jgi:hypothetical protein
MQDQTAPANQPTDTGFDWSQLPFHDEAAQAAMDQSDRMQGGTKRLGGTGPRLRLGPVPPQVRTPVPPQVRTLGTRRLASGRPKAQSTRSGAKSGDSGEDGEPSEPPPAGRLCECGCDRDISHKRADARYFEDKCRVRAQRARDAADPERVVERRLERLTVTELPGGCHAECRGEGVERDPEGAWICLKCGRPRTAVLAPVNGYDRRLAEVRSWMHNELAVVRRPRLPREWRTRPSRALSAQLRKTREGDWEVLAERRRARRQEAS